MMVDQLKQLEQVLQENEVDYLKLEGNIGAADLIKRKLLDETPSQILCKSIKSGCLIKYLDISNIKIKDTQRITFFRPSLKREIPNGNGTALSEILEALTISHNTLKNLEVLALNNVQLDERLVNGICLVL